PKSKAIELAKATNVPVLFTAVDIPVEVAAPIKSVDEPVVVQLKQARIMAIQPSGEEVQVAQVVTAPPAVALTATETLPKTARPLPFIALFGVLALGGVLMLRAFQRRIH